MDGIAIAALAGLFCLSAAAQTPLSPFQPARTIVLSGVTGRFDHLAVDMADNRLFIAATSKHSVEVVDLKTDKIQQSIGGLGKPHGLIWVPATSSLFVADGALGELRVYKGAPLVLAGSLKLSDDADDMVYDDATHLLFVGHGGSDAANPAKIAIVDTDHFVLVSNLPLATHPEALDIDTKNRRVFANIAESNEVAVIDTATRKIGVHWKMAKGADNVPLAFDAEHKLLYLACRTPGTVIVLDAATGKEIASLPTAPGADDLFYDPALGRVYVIAGWRAGLRTVEITWRRNLFRAHFLPGADPRTDAQYHFTDSRRSSAARAGIPSGLQPGRHLLRLEGISANGAV
jgi:DNA-binding beta-propeller fold protein YncE